MRPRFVIRLDDFCPGMRWDAVERVERLFCAQGVKPLIGVVPENRDPRLEVRPRREDFWEFVRSRVRTGWTVAQHGYQHVYCTRNAGLLGIQPRSEFAGLPFETQRRKLRLGREILERQGVPTRVFMAPAHSFDRGTLRALASLGITQVTDGYGLFPYEKDGLTFVPQLFSRPYHLGLGVYTLCLHLNEMGARELESLERFCRRRRDDIVSFPEAARLRGPAPLADLTRSAIHGGLRAARAVRRLVKG